MLLIMLLSTLNASNNTSNSTSQPSAPPQQPASQSDGYVYTPPPGGYGNTANDADAWQRGPR